MNKKAVQEWADENGFVLVSKENYDWLRRCTNKLQRLDKTFKVRVLNDKGECVALQG